MPKLEDSKLKDPLLHKPTASRFKEDNTIKSAMLDILDLSVTEKIQELLDIQGVAIDNINTVKQAMAAMVATKALSGNITAFEIVRDTIGEKPVDVIKQDTTIRIEMSDEARELAE